MENRKGMMKSFLFENLRDLMLRNVFEKITIKQICDQTGVIRATFYNYFEDKYDCLNAIVYHDLVENSLKIMDLDNVGDILEGMLKTVEKNLDFYRAGYNVTGQNSFEDMIRQNLYIIFKEFFTKYRKPGYLEKYNNDLLARYYAECVAFDLREFIFMREPRASVSETKQMMLDLMRNSMNDFIKQS